MRIFLAAVAGIAALFVSMFIGGIVLGALGKTESGTGLFLVAGLSGAAGAEVIKLVAPREGRGRAIFLVCSLVAMFLAVSLLNNWNELGRVAWGSVFLEGAIILGLFGSWCRWVQDEGRLALA